jgi:AmmeMemoRadiSam system protein B
MTVRRAAVAGTFYPRSARELAATVDALLAAAPAPAAPFPKAIVVPHAGYAYSGAVAATAYARIDPATDRVVMLGPAHRVALTGLALPSVDAFATPLGDVPIDQALRAQARECTGVIVDDRPHAAEHSLEVQLPFLQRRLPSGFTLTPFAVGSCPAETVAGVIDALWGGPGTLIVISSDLSHYESYEQASVHDRATAAAIVGGQGDDIRSLDACGAIPLRGLLAATHTDDLSADLLDLRSSGDTNGPRDRVVGYGAFAFGDEVMSGGGS